MSFRSLSCFFAISCSAFVHAADVSAFAGPEKSNVVSTRFKLSETDALAKRR